MDKTLDIVARLRSIASAATRVAAAMGLFGAVALVASCSSAPSSTTKAASAALCSVAPAQNIAGFRRTTLDSTLAGPGWVSAGDLNGDGRLDLVVSSLGPIVQDGSKATLSTGTVDVYFQGESLDCWEKHSLVGTADDIYFPNQTTLRDMDGDGDLDVFVPSGFFVCTFDQRVQKCGGLSWFENGPGGWARHDVIAPHSLAFYHQGAFADLDGDGVDDLVTVAETPSAPRAVWYRGTKTGARFDATALPIGDGGGSLPIVHDVDGDGDLDVVSAQYFATGGDSFVWFEQTKKPNDAAPAGVWEKHSLDSQSGLGFQVRFVDGLLDAGKASLVATNHTNVSTNAADAESAVVLLTPGADPRAPWSREVLSSGIVSRASVGSKVQGAPGVFGAGDIDGDGDVDLAIAGDGDARTYWMEQTARGVFAMHTLEEGFGQAAGALVTDLDGDGKNELVFTGYEANVVFVYSRRQ